MFLGNYEVSNRMGLKAAVRIVRRGLRPSWISGPIFDKELRVSSRRRRNYVLRFVYLSLLTVFVVLVWLATVEARRSFATQIAQMSEAGKAIIVSIVWFQFIATQLIVVIMLSTSISDEIYNRTLGLLMTTPINSAQIVMGKLSSKLLQLLLLLAISMPLLAVVRVFGGVPWSYVIAGMGITLSAVVFAGTLSLHTSISGRRAYIIILRTLFILFALYCAIPAIAFALWVVVSDETPGMDVVGAFMHTNPFMVLAGETETMMQAGGRGGPWISWPIHCAIMTGASALLLAWSTKRVRKLALRCAVGETDAIIKRTKRRGKRVAAGENPEVAPAKAIRRIKGSPVIWKELRTPFIEGGRNKSIIGLCVAKVMLLITYGIAAHREVLSDGFSHIFYTILFVGLGLVYSAVLSATVITAEKESRAWPILIATPMSDWHILLGKAVGVIRKCLPVWIFLFAHVLIFTVIGYIHPIAMFHLVILVTGVVVFLSGSGLYFSARFRRTTSAVVANVGLALTLWLIVPIVAGMVGGIVGHDDDTLWTSLYANPLLQCGVIMEGAGGAGNAGSELSRLDYDWPESDISGFGRTTSMVVVTMLAYCLAGSLFAWRSKHCFRKNVF